MKILKTVTAAKAAANKEVAQKSTGARTAAGKSAASRNAITHGFFAREVVLGDDNSRKLEALRRALHSRLSPETVTQEIAFDLIWSCIRRCKLALRQEMGRVRKLLGEFTAQQVQRGSENQVVATEWYLAGKQALREGMKLIQEVRAEYERRGQIDPKWNVSLEKAFGPQFRQLLTEWPPYDTEATMFAQMLIRHAKDFPITESLMEQPATEAKKETTPEVILDPEQNRRMVLKLLQQQEDVLLDLYRSLERRASDVGRTQNDPVDFTPRYFTTASRDLHRAVDWFLSLKEKNL